MGGKAQLRHRLSKHRRHLPVAVDHENVLGLGLLELADPIHQMVVVGVGAEALEIHHLGPDGYLLTEQLHTGSAVQQGTAQRTGRLEAHEHDAALRPPQVILQVVPDAACVAHTGGGQDHLGGAVHIQQLGLLHRLRQVQAGEAEHMGAVLHQRQRLLVQIAPQVAAEDGGGPLGQRTVHIHWEVLHGLHQILILDLPDKVQQLLGAAHGEGGDHHVAAPAQCLVDDLGQLVGIAPHLRVVAVAVGTLHHHIVCPGEELGVPDDGLIHVADIAGKDDGPRLAALGEGQADAGRAQQVAGIDEHGVYAVADVDLLAVLAGIHELPHPHGILHRVQRFLHGAARPLVLTVFILGVALLNMGGVLQHDIQQIRRQASGEDTALKTLLDQQGDTAGVVDMGVSHQHIVDLARMEGQAGVIDLVPALLQAAVNEDTLAAHLQTMAAAGNTLICSVKAQFHGVVPFLSFLAGRSPVLCLLRRVVLSCSILSVFYPVHGGP